MKKADDFRKAFGPATPGFESVVKKTIKELRAQEMKPVMKEWRRWRRPVFAMAMALVLFIGFVAVSGSLNPFSRKDRIRSEEENLYTAQPITTVLSMGAGQEEGDGDGAESVLSEEESIRIRLDEEAPGLSDKLFPVNLVCEKNGLRVEVISGYVSGTECQFMISMEDLEGKYDDSMVFPTFACDMAGFSGYSAGTVYTDEKKHKTVYLYTPNLSNPDLTEDRIITAGIDTVHVETLKDIDLLPMLGQYGKTVEGVKQPSQLKLAGTANKFPPKDMKFLDYTQPLDIPLFGDVCLSGIGWIDGQLHVQYHNTGAVSYSKGSVTYNNTWSVWEYGTAGMPAYSPVEWDADLDGYGEWEEFIYDLSPEETDGLELGATIKLLDKVLDDGWMVEIPLELICPDVLKMDPEIEEPAEENDEEAVGTEAEMDIEDIKNQIWRYFSYWAGGDVNGMLVESAYEWKAASEDHAKGLSAILEDGLPVSYQIVNISGSSGDLQRTVICNIQMKQKDGVETGYRRFDITLRKGAYGMYYVDPGSLKGEDPAELNPGMETVSLAAEDIINRNMDYFYPGIREQLIPVSASSEEAGIRFELLSAFVKDKKAWFVYTVKDPEGKFTGVDPNPWLNTNLGEVSTFSPYPLFLNEPEHTYTYMLEVEYNRVVSNPGRIAVLKIDNLNPTKCAWIDLAPLVKQYGTETEGVAAPKDIIDLQDPEQDQHPDLKILDNSNPLNIPVIGDCTVSAIGWIDGKLHIQFHDPSQITVSNYIQEYAVERLTNLSKEEQMKLYTVSGYDEWDWMDEAGGWWWEYALNYPPEYVDQVRLENTVHVYTDSLAGSWKAQVSLKTIGPDVKDEEAPPVQLSDDSTPIEELDEDWDMNLDEREGKIVFDAYASAKVYTKDQIGYVLKEDGTAESVKTSTWMPARDEIIIPERVRDYIVTAIGKRTFDGYDMKFLTLPDTVKTISEGAFSDCTNLVYLRIPDGVPSIEDDVFYNCVNLTDVTIPDSVTEIGGEAFYNCRNLAEIRIPEGTVSIGSYAFLGCGGLTSIKLPDGLETLGAYTFSRCNGLESVEIPGSVTSVEKASFKDCTGLKAVRLKEGIAEIGEDAFSGCGALETVELPASLLSIGDRAFRECGSLKKLVLPEGMTSIGRAAFMNCTGLEEIVIPESVTTMELHAFRGCINLTCVVKEGSYAKDFCEGNGIKYVVK